MFVGRFMAAVATALMPVVACAQKMPPGSTVASAAITGLAQSNTDLDEGGTFRWSGGLVSASLLHQVAPRFAAGFALSYGYESWRFDTPTAFGGRAPWTDLNRPQISATFMYAPTTEWRVLVAPSIEWDYESGASTGDATTYGAVVSATRAFSPELAIGLGVAAYRQIYRTRILPFPIIDWKIDERWSLSNPFPAGPTGGAGLELTYRVDHRWEIGGGVAYRSFLYRLDRNGAVPDGIAEINDVPLFLRVSRALDAQSQIDFYAAALTGGKLTLKSAQANDLVDDEFKTAPTLGITLRRRF